MRNRILYLDEYSTLYMDFRQGLTDQGKALFIVLTLFLLCMGACPGILFGWYAFMNDFYILELGTASNKPMERIYIGTESTMTF